MEKKLISSLTTSTILAINGNGFDGLVSFTVAVVGKLSSAILTLRGFPRLSPSLKASPCSVSHADSIADRRRLADGLFLKKKHTHTKKKLYAIPKCKTQLSRHFFSISTFSRTEKIGVSHLSRVAAMFISIPIRSKKITKLVSFEFDSFLAFCD